MCGIAGFCLNPKHKSNTSDIASQMLLDIEHRGQHATGAAWINPKSGSRVITKAPIAASQFIGTKAGRKVCQGANTAILHTRWATQGSPKINDNNHPIPRGKIVVTHNGHISNDKALFKQLKVDRVAQVDSEAVAALIAFAASHPTEYLPQIRGTAALAWITAGEGNILHLARVSSSPLWIGQTSKGSLVYGSTQETIENASVVLDEDLEWQYTASEGDYFKVKDGKIVEFKQFTPTKDSFSSSWDYRTYRDDKWDKYYDDEHSMLNF